MNRFFNPSSLAVIGGGAWGEAVVRQAQSFGYRGDIWPIHPSRMTIADLPVYRGVPDLPDAPDAAFVGINRDATIGAVERLRRRGAGGAVCFASGFAETAKEDELGRTAQARLLKAAQDMPVLGPNCYGFINALDRAIVWPDQHGMTPVDRGVAILTQSSNIAINLSFQNRALPIAMMITCGNMAQTTQADLVKALLADDRITAIGLHIEGFGPLPSWEAAAQVAHAKGVPLVAIKAGRSAAARAATQSHTASMAGDDAGADALLRFLGIGRVDTLPEFLECLKLGHMCGRLANRQVASISCSGGEAALAADLGKDRGVTFPPLTDQQHTDLRAALGPQVALANPLDYHTYIWRDVAAMTKAWTAISSPENALNLTIVDLPDTQRADPTDWNCAIDAAINTHAATGANMAFVATLPEGLPEPTAQHLMQNGVVPMHGLSEALAAVVALNPPAPKAGLISAPIYDYQIRVNEPETKQHLSDQGLDVPKSAQAMDHAAVNALAFPVVAKRTDVAHKSDENAVVLNITNADQIPEGFDHVEEMIQDGVAELLVALTNDPAHGVMLTLGAGGTETELWQDTQHLMLPVVEQDILATLQALRIAPLLSGFRSRPAADIGAICGAVLQLQDFVIEHRDGFVELEINPLICTPERAVIADAIWVRSQPEAPA